MFKNILKNWRDTQRIYTFPSRIYSKLLGKCCSECVCQYCRWQSALDVSSTADGSQRMEKILSVP